MLYSIIAQYIILCYILYYNSYHIIATFKCVPPIPPFLP